MGPAREGDTQGCAWPILREQHYSCNQQLPGTFCKQMVGVKEKSSLVVNILSKFKQ